MSFEWQQTTLGEICAYQKGSIQTGPFGSQLHASDYKDVGIPVVMPANIGDGRLVEDNIARIDLLDVERLSKHKLQLGDIVFSRRGDVTKNALIQTREVGWLCGTGCLKIDLGNQSKGYSNFISHYLRLPEIKDWLIRHSVGATMPNLNTSILSAIPIKLPPFQTQFEIAFILDSLDNRISLLRETNTTLEAIAQTLFKSWFVDFDPVKAKAQGKQPEGMDEATAALFPSEFEESALGLIPKGWRVGTLGEIVSARGGFAYKGDSFKDIGHPVIKIKNIVGDGTVNFSDAQCIDNDLANKTAKFILKDGDIVIAMTGATIGKTGIIVTDGKNPYLNQRVAKFESKLKDQKYTWFVFIAFQYGGIFEQVVNTAQGSAQPNISTTGIESVRLILPNHEDLLLIFNDIVTPLFLRWIDNQKQSQTLTTLRDTLLPRLISGQLRINQAQDLINSTET